MRAAPKPEQGRRFLALIEEHEAVRERARYESLRSRRGESGREEAVLSVSRSRFE
jgi:hypothetical protein